MLRFGAPPAVMAILNATPDSFSGDGVPFEPALLAARAVRDVADGAAVIDVGGESTRPGAAPVPLEVELARVLPVLRALAGKIGVPLSIDTMKADVADAALGIGATIVNDVSGLRDERLAPVAARHGAWLVLTHNGHTVRDRGIAESGDPVEDVVREIERLADVARRAGVDEGRLIADPGLGFGKPAASSLALLARTAELRRRLAPLPLLVGPSRKSFIGGALDLPVEERLEGTLACVAIAAFAGAELIRVHDVRAAARAVRMAHALSAAAPG
ncbi:MAG TPA: dihydropteroate synthase [Candidatus Limnocylindria bacterium]|nr:dihydropteroate synthase [Candidatus Limnocylindria bacterium]